MALYGPDQEEENSGSGASAARVALDRDKFKAEQDAAKKALERTQFGARQSADYFRKLLDSGMNIGGLESQIAKQETEGRQYIADQAKMLSDLISGRRTQAMQTTTAGYDALRNYLGANPMQAYAQTQRAVPTVQQGILDQYMASRGINAAPAQAGQDVVNAQLAAQAGNYNQLLNVLTGAESQQNASRAAEEQMARALAGTQLEALYGSQTAGLEQQRLAALNDLANRISAARLQNERDRIAREQQLQDAIAKLLGTGLFPARPQEQGGADTGGGTTGGGTTGGGTTGGGTTGGGTTGGGTTGGGTTGGAASVAPVRPIDALAERAAKAEAAGNTRLADRIEKFIETNPNAGIKKIEKEFPQIGAAIRATPQPDPVSQAQAQAAQAALNQRAAVDVNAVNPLIALNPLTVAELQALISQAQYAPGYGSSGAGAGGVFGNEMTMY